jgi:hypothetical protein
MTTVDIGKICQAQHTYYFSFSDLDKPLIDSLKEVAITKRKFDKSSIEA